MKTIPMTEARTTVLLIALAIGFGLAFHPIFFLVAAVAVLLALGQWTVNEIHKFLVDFRRKETLTHWRLRA